MPINDAKSICKTIMRNGYDAYVISATLQQEIQKNTGIKEISIACATDYENLIKFFPNLEESNNIDEIAILVDEELGYTYRFYASNISTCAPPASTIVRVTRKMLSDLQSSNQSAYEAVTSPAGFLESDRVICDLSCGCIKMPGIPLFTLQGNYSIAIRALRMAANYELPIDPNTWVAIVQSASKIVDYVPAEVFMEEWRLVSAEAMWKFIELLQESTILFGLMPELATLASLKQNINRESLEEETVFEHTIRCMKHYPEERLHHDWLGVVATLFHQIGKSITTEQIGGRWYFFQYHRVGASIARKVLRRLHFDAEDIEIICNMARNHIRFQSMMTDRGIRQFLELPDTERVIELSRAIIKATSEANYTNFNHNLKYMERGDTPLSMLEPLLNGNEIMEYATLAPGPKVGIIREALLNAQIADEVHDTSEAIVFIKSFIEKLNHTQLESMLTDTDIRQFLGLSDTERNIELSRAIIKERADRESKQS